MAADAGLHDRRLRASRVLVTRERPGELARLLEAEGAEVLHLPLIEVVDADPDDVEVLRAALDAAPDWIIVTSPAGVERIADHAGKHTGVRLGVVGTATARCLEEMVGRPADLVPSRQIGTALAAAFNRSNPVPQTVVLAQADRAGSDVADGLRSAGHSVVVATAYRTLTRQPSADEIVALGDIDMVLFASGSAAQGWSDAFGAEAADRLPRSVVVIGPSTAAAAWESGLKVTDIAADHSLAGLVEAAALAWRRR